jgi:hypothetical protein
MAEAPTATMAVPRGRAAKQLNSNLQNRTISDNSFLIEYRIFPKMFYQKELNVL